ncbi:MAG: thiamine phosphate synthase [Candidatus Omnitrophica bacterium]|nr:thiamine phosphate synthase [Candidatus Omnitrophota bacterium]
MRLKKELLKSSRIYLILDTQVKSYDQLFEIVKKAFQSGIRIFQLRDKCGSARDILRFCDKMCSLINDEAIFIINDRIDLALIGRADGVHLGQDDIPLSSARGMVGFEPIIGVSCQNLEHAREAQAQGADYIGFGSVFKTLTKPDRLPMDLDLLQKVAREITIPVFAIGGINKQNIKIVLEQGIKYVAVCRSLLDADNFAKDAAELQYLIKAKEDGLRE